MTYHWCCLICGVAITKTGIPKLLHPILHKGIQRCCFWCEEVAVTGVCLAKIQRKDKTLIFFSPPSFDKREIRSASHGFLIKDLFIKRLKDLFFFTFPADHYTRVAVVMLVAQMDWWGTKTSQQMTGEIGSNPLVTMKWLKAGVEIKIMKLFVMDIYTFNPFFVSCLYFPLNMEVWMWNM